MRYIIVFGFLMSVLNISFSQKKAPLTDKRLAGLEAELEKVLKTWNAPGFAVAIVEKDKIIYSKGFGYRDVENKLPVTPNTHFAIGSCTKAFTSAILGILRDENKLSLDDSPIKHLPELRFFNNDMNNQLTIKDLMTHRTGLPRHDFSWYLFPTHSRDSLIGRIEHQKPFAGVREKWYYNNFMFLAQGVIAEKITGKSWEENISEYFFKPLEMKNSTAVIDGLKKGKEAAFGYDLKNDTIFEKTDYYDIAAMAPAGSINSSVYEMANWVSTWINGGKFKGNQIIPESYVREAINSHMIVNSDIPDSEFPDIYMGNYGYGWFVSSYKGHYRVEHGGNIDGFSANTSFFPTDSIGIIVLVNQNRSGLPSLIRNIISDRFLGLKITDWNKINRDRVDEAKKKEKETKVESDLAVKKGTKTSHVLIEYTGKYEHPGYGSFDIVVENDSLFLNTSLKKMWLKHYHYDIFTPFEIIKGKIDTTQASGLRFNFRTSDAGEISSLHAKLEPTLDPLEFKRTPKIVTLDTQLLNAYVGEYELAGATTKFYLRGAETLYLFVPGQPEYELLATEKHKFSIKTLEGFKIEFIPGDGDEIKEVLFIQPNGTFKATKK